MHHRQEIQSTALEVVNSYYNRTNYTHNSTQQIENMTE